MLTASSRIWTQSANFISYEDNRYAKSTSFFDQIGTRIIDMLYNSVQSSLLTILSKALRYNVSLLI